MNHRSILFGLLIVVIFALAACGETPATTVPAVPTAPIVATAKPAAPTIVSSSAAPVTTPTNVAIKVGTPAPASSSAASTQVLKGALSCPAPAPLPANTQLAARVNGVGISLDLYNRQVAQAQEAMIKNFGTDPKSAQGQETIKALKQQVLDLLINEVVIARYAESRKIKVTDDELNTRLAQMIQDAGGVDKLNEYMSKHQLTLTDLCIQVRNQLLGDAVLNEVTAPIPTKGEQVHARHILVEIPALAQTLRDRARKGEDFAALAKQYSKDEATKDNGGDLGWVPRGVLDPQLEAVIFEIPVNQVSDVVTAQFGYHVAQVLEKEKSRPFPPEFVQTYKQEWFLKWLRAERETLKIELLVQP